jgi:hypothetical protein
MLSHNNLYDTPVIFHFLNPSILSLQQQKVPSLHQCQFHLRLVVLHPNLVKWRHLILILILILQSFQLVKQFPAINPIYLASFPSLTTAKSSIAAPMPIPFEACGVPPKLGQMATLNINLNPLTFSACQKFLAINPIYLASFPSLTTAKSSIAAPMPIPFKACGVPPKLGEMATLNLNLNPLIFSACRTISGNKPNSPCVFPFTYNGKKFHRCTNADSIQGLWCSTRTWSNGDTVREHWGFCGQGCS